MSRFAASGMGKVYLVGAGPWDPGLITVRGLTYLRQAQVVVYDRLVHPALLEEASPGAERLDVGKVPGRHPVPQAEINALLIARASKGSIVVRLKGGDPFVFGRGGEECQALAQAGVPFEVVPGVSSAVAVPAYAGIPVTHRAYASSFTVVTGHTRGSDGSPLHWPHVAQAETLIILMGLRRLPGIVQQLLSHGRSPETPVAVVQWGTTAEQTVAAGTLADIVGKTRGLESPATIIIGQVVALRNQLQWFDASVVRPGGRPEADRPAQVEAPWCFSAPSSVFLA
jgi:uroporphyrin-III C-methyltransferase